MTQPTTSQIFDLATQRHRAGQLREAERFYRQILAQEPQHAGALHHLGVLANQVGKREIAVELIRRAVAANPNNPDACCNLGNALKDVGRIDEAIAAYRQAIALSPNLAEAHNNLGNALRDKKQLDEAIAELRHAIALNSNSAEAHCNLGNVLIDKGRLEEAIAVLRRALELKPNFPEAYYNLGIALRDNGRLDEAIAAYRRAISLRPQFAEAHSNLGISVKDKGNFEEAIAEYRKAIALKPDYVDAHWNLAVALLSTGQFAEGWEEFEWRLRKPSLKVARHFPQPIWNGEDIPNQTLLIYPEGGFGDALNFIRLVPLIAARAGKIIIELHPDLMQLFADVPGVSQWVARGEALPAFDRRISLSSLPRILGIRAQRVPNSVPYLRAPRTAVESWKARIPRDGTKNIGLCWAGSRAEVSRRSREIGILAPLAQVAGVRYFSLQKGPETDQPRPEGLEIIDHTQELGDFADTAALIENLDLVISVDTSVAHLAGALAKPVWTLIPNRPDFRWLVDRSDSPWYPTMRLFRQNIGEDWNPAVARLVDALQDWVKNR
jgi:Tfp pilus assembly protein PilF